jgi:hypothetical protein
MSKSTYDLIAEAADRLARAVRRGLPFGRKSVTVTLSDETARAVEAALTSIIGKDGERASPIDACKNWAGTCSMTCDTCRDSYVKENAARRAKFDTECDRLYVVTEKQPDGTFIDSYIEADEVALPWSFVRHPIPGLGYSVRDAYGRQRALVPDPAVAELIITSVAAGSSSPPLAPMDATPHPEWLELKRGAGIPHCPTALTYDCRRAVAGEGPRAADWADKPHRLVFDLSREIERMSALASGAADGAPVPGH